MKRAARWLRRNSAPLPWIAALIGLTGVLILLGRHIDKKGGALDSTALALVAIGVGLVFAVIAPWPTARALRRVTALKVAGIELGLGIGEIKRAERVRPLRREDDGVGVKERPLSGDPGEELRDVVEAMQGRLRFCWDIFDLRGEKVEKEDYRRITRRLGEKERITRDEQKFILDLLHTDDRTVEQWSADTRDEFLDSAWEFAIRFGPLIWDRHVRRALQDHGWFIAQYPQERGHRPDFLGHHSKGWAVMAARVAGPEDDPVGLKPSRDRLRAIEQDFIDARCIVIPDIREVKSYKADVNVLRLDWVLRHPEAVFA